MSQLLPAQTKAWWKEVVCYQIYPSSFCDANGDGEGDLKGITSKLDYLKELGVDMVWLCPIYKSPMIDMGYDISDYQDIHPTYGTLKDWEELVAGLHSRGIKLIHDLVVNHTSDQHPWFQASKSSKDDPKRDYFIWRPAKIDEEGNRQPPNNWSGIWGGSAWEWDEHTQEYYFHIFSKEQPDLNFEFKELREEVKNLMRFWLEKGIDGFRLDAINFISKRTDFPDAEIVDKNSKYQNAFHLFNHGPRVHEFLAELYADVLSKYDAFTVGESAGTSPEQAIDYVRQSREKKELQMIFHTDHIDLYGGFEIGPSPPLRTAEFRDIVARWQTFMMENDGWQSIYDSNHDQPRPVNNILRATSENRDKAAKLLALFQSTLVGTLFLYQGEEIGMMNVPESWPIEEYKDLVTQGYYKDVLQRRQKESGTENPDMSDVMQGIQRKARDNARVPMAWDETPTAGFTTGKPWMRVNEENKACNVRQQRTDSNSIFSFWKQMIKLRKTESVLVYGIFELVKFPNQDDIVAYTRKYKDSVVLVVANFSDNKMDVNLAGLSIWHDKVETIISNYQEPSNDTLLPYDARLYRLA